MTAQILKFPARNKHARVAPSRGRGLRLNDETASLLARLNRGETITDIGQISAPARRLLNRLVARGWLCKGVDYTFPALKTCYGSVNLTLGDIEGHRVTFCPGDISEIRSGDRRRFPPVVSSPHCP